MTTTTTGLVLSDRTRARFRECMQHIDRMRAERVGWGKDAEAEVAATERSLLRALDTLIGAREVWPDGTSSSGSLSFGGMMPGGIDFGMIARRGTCRFPDVHTTPPVEWTFHS